MAGSLAAVNLVWAEPPSCTGCGRPLGVYEPLYWRRPDGRLETSGWLTVRDDPDHAHPRSAFFHPHCLGEAT